MTDLRVEVATDIVDRALDAYINWSDDWRQWAPEDVAKCRANMSRALATIAPVAPDVARPERAIDEAKALVARWEHGDEAHRQWLRDVAVPDIARALTAARIASPPPDGARENELPNRCGNCAHYDKSPLYPDTGFCQWMKHVPQPMWQSELSSRIVAEERTDCDAFRAIAAAKGTRP
jgi:hypothetical protein